MLRAWLQAHPRVRAHAPWVVPLVAYAIALAAVSLHHELWRDEVRPLGIVADTPTPWALVANLKNEGHPLLWYVLVWLATLGGWLPWMLKPLAIAVAVASGFVVLRHAPWPLWVRILFLFGLFPFYEDGVMVRNYGITLLCLSWVCVAWPERWQRPLRLAVPLALLANSNAHSLVLVAALLVALGLELAVRRRFRGFGGRGLAALALVLLAALAAVLVIRPDDATIVTGVAQTTPKQVLTTAGSFFQRPLRVCPELVGMVADDPRLAAAPAAPPVLDGVGTTALALFAVALAVGEWPLAIAGILGLLGLSVFGDLVYRLVTRHQGVAYVFLVALAWMLAAARPTGWGARLERGVRAVLPVVFVIQVWAAWTVVARDWQRPMSSSQRFGELVASHPELREAVVLGEPDYDLEALPYYAQNPVYLAREGRPMPGRTSFTTANRQSLTLGELLDAAQAEKAATGKPVLLVLGTNLKLGPSGPFTITHGIRKRFVYDAASYARLGAETTVVQRLDGAIGDENYVVYRLR